MIEKIKSPLDLKVGNYKGTEFDIIPADTFAMVCRKINSLVDAVNELQKHTDRLSCAILDLATPDGENKALESIKAESKPTENLQDKFAEQRKWIGKLCRFKDNDDDKWNYSVLKSIDTDTDFPFWDTEDYEWAMCEPVSPEDDIIYQELTPEYLRNLMATPKYWKEQDPEIIRKVEQGFKKLYGDKGE